MEGDIGKLVATHVPQRAEARQRREILQKTVAYLFLIAGTAVMAIPFFAMVVFSFQEPLEWATTYPKKLVPSWPITLRELRPGAHVPTLALVLLQQLVYRRADRYRRATVIFVVRLRVRANSVSRSRRIVHNTSCDSDGADIRNVGAHLLHYEGVALDRYSSSPVGASLDRRARFRYSCCGSSS